MNSFVFANSFSVQTARYTLRAPNAWPLETNNYRHIALGLPSLKGASRAIRLFIQITKELFD
jgi:hypothetical protein